MHNLLLSLVADTCLSLLFHGCGPHLDQTVRAYRRPRSESEREGANKTVSSPGSEQTPSFWNGHQALAEHVQQAGSAVLMEVAVKFA